MSIIDQLLDRIAQAKSINRPLSEITLHPDDYKRVLHQIHRWAVFGKPSQTRDQFFGLPVVIDADAPKISPSEFPSPPC